MFKIFDIQDGIQRFEIFSLMYFRWYRWQESEITYSQEPTQIDV